MHVKPKKIAQTLQQQMNIACQTWGLGLQSVVIKSKDLYTGFFKVLYSLLCKIHFYLGNWIAGLLLDTHIVWWVTAWLT